MYPLAEWKVWLGAASGAVRVTAVEYWIVEDLRAVGCWLRFADRRRGAEHRPKLVETPETRRFRQVVREGLARGVLSGGVWA